MLVAPFQERSGTVDPQLYDLLIAAPLLPVVAAADLGESARASLRQIVAWGISEVLDIRLESRPEALERRLRVTHGRPLKRRIESGLSRFVSANALTLVRAAVEVACDGGLSSDLASVFGVNERTVGDWCTRAGVPPPRRLLAWARVLLGTALLEETRRSWVNVARCSGYVEANSLRRAIRTLVPEAMSDASGHRPEFTRAMSGFEADLRRHRERVRKAPGPRDSVRR
ncbi:MAG: hypothetical protein JO306_03845 [Gemmatimonadetes bacterium]|nr:hypothetical protein [Gemmatimonadota bacterium]